MPATADTTTILGWFRTQLQLLIVLQLKSMNSLKYGSVYAELRAQDASKTNFGHQQLGGSGIIMIVDISNLLFERNDFKCLPVVGCITLVGSTV
jgi:hypothetical protein